MTAPQARRSVPEEGAARGGAVPHPTGRETQMNAIIDHSRFLAIYLMTMSHMPHATPVMNGYVRDFWNMGWAEYLVLFTGDGVARISAPLLGLFSGYLAVRSIAKRGAGDLLRTRFRTLLIPAWIWSVAMLALWFLTGLAKGDLRNWFAIFDDYGADAVLGIFRMPLNYSMHYVIDLFKCSLLFVVVEAALRHVARFRPVNAPAVYMTIAVVGAAALTFGTLDLTSPYQPGLNEESFLPRSDLFLFFFVGIGLARGGMEAPKAIEQVVARMTPLRFAAVFAAFSLAAVSWRALVELHEIWPLALAGLLLFVVRITGSVLMACTVIWGRRAFDWLNVSSLFAFRLFCIHALVFSVIGSLIELAHIDLAPPLIFMTGLMVFPLIAVAVTWASLKLQDMTPLRGVKI